MCDYKKFRKSALYVTQRLAQGTEEIATLFIPSGTEGSRQDREALLALGGEDRTILALLDQLQSPKLVEIGGAQGAYRRLAEGDAAESDFLLARKGWGRDDLFAAGVGHGVPGMEEQEPPLATAAPECHRVYDAVGWKSNLYGALTAHAQGGHAVSAAGRAAEGEPSSAERL
jgi:hypothetical protein